MHTYIKTCICGMTEDNLPIKQSSVDNHSSVHIAGHQRLEQVTSKLELNIVSFISSFSIPISMNKCTKKIKS